MIKGSCSITINQSTLEMIIQRWLDEECSDPPKVTSLNYRSGVGAGMWEIEANIEEQKHETNMDQEHAGSASSATTP